MGKCVNLCEIILNNNQNPCMISFLGEFEATVDAKGRFLLPAAVKKQLPQDAPARFVINRGFEKCLTLYPVQSWEPIFTQISEQNDFDPEVRAFRRYFFNGATEVELDTAGRLLLPKNLLPHAGIQKDIVLVSALNKMEIWDKDTYDAFFNSITPENFSVLANKVMNKKKGEE